MICDGLLALTSGLTGAIPRPWPVIFWSDLRDVFLVMPRSARAIVCQVWNMTGLLLGKQWGDEM